eukprot:GFKZ01015175.1.p1 GENE.GFKZ01015175.1~~GFKZ01015175.1.p1  ORF type:complete len:479 (-),score=81.55 GFKZ01015175.1:704-2140(-)
MGKKHGKSKKKTQTISLAEFNQDAGLGGVDPSLSALPTAPKAAEDWEAEGGRPEYNSRGYKERTSNRTRDSNRDADFQDRDWTRKGPLEEKDRGNAFGLGGADRDWGDMRRGPLEAPETSERNWDGMRRGQTVDSMFEGNQDRDWVRKGPIESDQGNMPRVISDENWASARKMTVDADVPEQKKEVDWGVRKGPVEAQGGVAQKVDWTQRKGPIEADAPAKVEEDWTRKGPVDAEVTTKRADEDWGSARERGPVDAAVDERHVADKEWTRKGPVEAEVQVDHKPRQVDLASMRGSKLKQFEDSDATNGKQDGETIRREGMEKDSWRGAGRMGTGRRDPVIRERPASTGQDFAGVTQERDWGAARRSQPLREREFRPRRGQGGRFTDGNDVHEVAQAEGDHTRTEDDGDDWTTVRSGAQKRAAANANRRYHGRDTLRGFQRRGGRDNFRTEKPATADVDVQNKPNSSPVTPIASAMSES